jgi:hypothetical protein
MDDDSVFDSASNDEAREAAGLVKDLDKYVYKFQPLTQTFHREPSKASQTETFERKEAGRRERLAETITHLNDSVVLRGAPRIMSSYYKSWIGMEPAAPKRSGVDARARSLSAPRIEDSDDSSDEEDNNLTITHIPKIDRENPLSIQFERMGQTMTVIDLGEGPTVEEGGRGRMGTASKQEFYGGSHSGGV